MKILVVVFFIFDLFFSKKKKNKEKPEFSISPKFLQKILKRKLMLGPPPPPVTVAKHAVAPQSIPQVNAPRLFIKNFPKPSGFDIDFPTYQIPNENNIPTIDAYPGTIKDEKGSNLFNFTQQDGNTFFNARKLKNQQIVNQNTKQQKSERKLHSKKNSLNLKKRALKKERKLTYPYLNSTPGFIDIGSSDNSPMALKTEMSLEAFAPFIPRANPPPRMKLEYRQYNPEIKQRKKLFEEERKIKEIEIEDLKREINTQYQSLITLIPATKSYLKEQMNKLKEHVKKIKEQKINDYNFQTEFEAKKQKALDAIKLPIFKIQIILQ